MTVKGLIRLHGVETSNGDAHNPNFRCRLATRDPKNAPRPVLFVAPPPFGDARFSWAVWIALGAVLNLRKQWSSM